MRRMGDPDSRRPMASLHQNIIANAAEKTIPQILQVPFLCRKYVKHNMSRVLFLCQHWQDSRHKMIPATDVSVHNKTGQC